jgi:hypothetical protein
MFWAHEEEGQCCINLESHRMSRDTLLPAITPSALLESLAARLTAMNDEAYLSVRPPRRPSAAFISSLIPRPSSNAIPCDHVNCVVSFSPFQKNWKKRQNKMSTFPHFFPLLKGAVIASPKNRYQRNLIWGSG